ncbi:putative helicase MOV-10 [Drosophila montana]|uniref:putative helicase MOV-10 n=1 Tax=Drosophila montana TaxID=40370 RepID=UPI00313DCE6F
MANLKFYKPSTAMLQAYMVNFNDQSLRENDTCFGEYLETRQLSFDNICSVLKKLLTIEDLSKMDDYTQLMQTNVSVTRVDGEHYEINLSHTEVYAKDVLKPDVDELVLVPNASLLEMPLPNPLILAQMPHIHESLNPRDNKRRHVGSIVQVNNTSVIFEYSTIDLINLNKKWNIIFRSPRIPFRLMYHALDLLMVCRTERNYLFAIPNLANQLHESDCFEDFNLINTQIATNSEQLQAVKQIVNGPNSLAPYIVFGPPGTGKTTTIVEAVLQLCLLRPKSHIIVTAGSNSACDTVALKICELIENNVRFADQKKNVVLRVFSRKRYEQGLENVHPLVVKYSNCANDYKNFNSLKLKKYRIIVSTLCLVGLLALNDSDVQFTHVFIDEAAASTEPETLLGIVGVKNAACHIILSGDHNQLGPFIGSQRASSLGFGQSLLERLMLSRLYQLDASGNYDRTLQTRLRRNYRSHPEIVGLFNKLYYHDELIPLAPTMKINMAAKWNQLANAKFPILFHNIYGKTCRKMHSRSRYNQQEAQVLSWYVRILLGRGIGGGLSVKQQDIGVITPYLAQCELIKQIFIERGLFDVDVGTVQRYQGREKPIIVVSMVSSYTSTTFVTNPRLLNVILSRAMSLLIIIGNPVSLGASKDIQYIINKCELHENVLGKKIDNKTSLQG